MSQKLHVHSLKGGRSSSVCYPIECNIEVKVLAKLSTISGRFVELSPFKVRDPDMRVFP